MKNFLSRLKQNKLFPKLLSVMIICVLFCSILVVPSSAADEEVTDLTGTTWIFNDELIYDEELFDSTRYLDFNYNGIQYSGFYFQKWNPQGNTSGYRNVLLKFDGPSSSIPVYYFYMAGGTENYPVGYQVSTPPIITINGGADVTNSVVISWVSSNALKALNFSVLGRSFYALPSMTWSIYVESDLNSGSFTIDGDTVFYEGYRLDGVKASDLIEADRNYSFPPTASYLLTVEGVIDWVIATINDSVKIFYVQGQGLTLVGVLGVVSLGISLAFLFIGVISNFLKNRG